MGVNQAAPDTAAAAAFVQIGQETLRRSVEALSEAERSLAGASEGAQFARACQLLLDCRGKVVCTGIGKSSQLARNLSATLSALGTPSFFIHACEAAHGDLGSIGSEDVLIALSNSGETEEVLGFAAVARRRGLPVIGLTGALRSPLATLSAAVIDIGVHSADQREYGAAPMASAVATMALGHALAAAVATRRGYSRSDFLENHPGGALGRSLLLEEAGDRKSPSPPPSDPSSSSIDVVDLDAVPPQEAEAGAEQDAAPTQPPTLGSKLAAALAAAFLPLGSGKRPKAAP